MANDITFHLPTLIYPCDMTELVILTWSYQYHDNDMIILMWSLLTDINSVNMWPWLQSCTTIWRVNRNQCDHNNMIMSYQYDHVISIWLYQYDLIFVYIKRANRLPCCQSWMNVQRVIMNLVWSCQIDMIALIWLCSCQVFSLQRSNGK